MDLGFWGERGFWLQNTTRPWHKRLPRSHGAAAHTSSLFIAPLSSSFIPPYFFNLFQGSCETSRDFAERPSSIFPPRSAPVSAMFCRRLPPLWERERLFPTTGQAQHRANQPQRLFPTVFILKIKSYRSPQAPLGSGLGGDRSVLSVADITPARDFLPHPRCRRQRPVRDMFAQASPDRSDSLEPDKPRP